jgi:hypothetical protein
LRLQNLVNRRFGRSPSPALWLDWLRSLLHCSDHRMLADRPAPRLGCLDAAIEQLRHYCFY